MSFLNPTAWSPRLGIGVAPLLRVRNQQHGPSESDLAWFVNTAESAGADAIVLALSTPPHAHQQSDVDAVLSAMGASQLAVPLSDAMIDYVCAVRPEAVCFRADPTSMDGLASNVDADTWLYVIQRAVTRLDALSVRVMMSIEPESALVSQLHQAGVTSVELNTMHFAQALQKTDALRSLQETVDHAKQLGMAVQLGHGIQYGHIEQIASLVDIDQINVGNAIVRRALMVGWSAAVSEMKALLVSSHAPIRSQVSSHYYSNSGAAS